MKTIFLVSYHVESLANRRQALEDAGYAVLTASSCEQALQCLTPSIDVAILCGCMPTRDLQFLAANIRANDARTQTFVLNPPSLLGGLLHNLVTGYLTSEGSPQELVQVLRSLEDRGLASEYKQGGEHLPSCRCPICGGIAGKHALG